MATCPTEESMDYEEATEGLEPASIPSVTPQNNLKGDPFEQGFPSLPEPSGSLNFQKVISGELKNVDISEDITSMPVDDTPKVPEANENTKTSAAEASRPTALVFDTTLIDYLVIDSNGYILFMKEIKEQIVNNSTDYPNAKIYLPRVVQRELGKLKRLGKDATTRKSARIAIAELEELSKGKTKKYEGQIYHDYKSAAEKFSFPEAETIADDRILQCCLHLKETCQYNVHLISFDKGFRNLARDNGIQISPFVETWEFEKGNL